MTAYLVPIVSEDTIAYGSLKRYLPHLSIIDLTKSQNDLSVERPDIHIFLERMHIRFEHSETPTPYDVLGATLRVAEEKGADVFVFRAPYNIPFLAMMLMMELRRRGKTIIVIGPPQNLGEALALVDAVLPFEDERAIEVLHHLL